MLESLKDLDDEIRKRNSHLFLFQGKAEEVVERLIDVESIEAVFVNRDYTPFSIKRDKHLEALVRKKGVDFNSHSDLLLTEVGSVMTGKGTPYTVFTHFANKATRLIVEVPQKNPHRNFLKKRISLEKQNAYEAILPKFDYNKEIFISGGRKNAVKILKKANCFSNDGKERDISIAEATTSLSAHNKFGTVSIREVYKAISESLGSSHSLIRQLYWRDFFTHVAFHFPHVFGNSFHEKYNNISWSDDRRKFKAWCKGETGFPIIDAGMRQLNVTGFMHNRVRMIVASFLVKDLHIDWRWGEKYFAQNLIDYDPAVNNGNWQWAASTGCDAQPYFRIFNPWIQQKKFDPDCRYIKKWVPELQKYQAMEIHKLAKGNILQGYPKAIVEHSEVKHAAEDMFIEAAEKAKN